jgi:hypothetical protein
MKVEKKDETRITNVNPASRQRRYIFPSLQRAETHEIQFMSDSLPRDDEGVGW